MFEGITRGLSDALEKLRGRGRLTADNIREGLREVRRALLEADVNLTVVTQFIKNVETKAVGTDVLERIDPSEQIIQIVYEELCALMGPVDQKIPQKADRPVVLMLCGLQGAGKTTTAAKLALTLKSKGRKPFLAAADLQRPGAVEQLQTLGEQIEVPVFSEKTTPVDVCLAAIAQAKKSLCDVVILDTAGRLQIDDALMAELKQIDKFCKPDEVYLVVDAMIGQEAANVAKAFNDALELERLHPDEARWRCPRWCGAVHQGRHRRADQVHRRWREARQTRRVRSRTDGRPHHGPGRSHGRRRARSPTSRRRFRRRRCRSRQEALKKGTFTLEMFRTQFEMIAKMRHEGHDRPHARHERHDPAGEDPEVALKRVQG